MKHLKLILLILLTAIGVISFAQNNMDSSDRVHKYFSLEIGPKINIRSTPDTLAGSGGAIMLEYGWQVSGFNGKKCRSFISIPLGYSMISDNKNHNSSTILNYGVAITHELTKDTNNVPFIGYALLLNQQRFDGIKGSVFGHQSRFEFGVNHYISNKWVLYGKLGYSYCRFPSLYASKSNQLHQIEVKFGAKFIF